MANKTKVKISVKGTPEGVKKALHKITSTVPEEPIYREADFRARQKRLKGNANG